MYGMTERNKHANAAHISNNPCPRETSIPSEGLSPWIFLISIVHIAALIRMRTVLKRAIVAEKKNM
jgi:hypothetical protein